MSDLQRGADVPSFEDLHINAPIAATLDRWGWSPDDQSARQAAPTAARGHNLVAVTPPVPAYAAPATAGVLSRLQQNGRALFIVPSNQLEEWGAMVQGLVRGTRLRVQVARGTARAMRQLRADAVDAVVATPETALTLVTRSALRMDLVQSLVLAWPELLPDEDSITPLMQDLSKEAQRVIYTAEPQRVAALAERYARKALPIGLAGDEGAAASPVRTVSAPWAGRIQALADLVELLDPASLVIWTADRRYHDTIAQAVALNEPEVRLTTGEAPSAGTIVAFDLPTRERLQQLLAAGEVVLLVPPGTENYLKRIAARPRPLQLPGLLDAVRSAESAQRSTIIKALQSGHSERSLLTLAPLFERYDAAAVAAALFELWTSSGQATPQAQAAPPTSKIYVGVGKKDGATANDLVAVLTKDLRVDRTKIGRIELRDVYSLIEFPAQEAEQVAAALNGVTIRRKRVTARVDRGPSRPIRSDGGKPARPAGRADRR